jgi:hypothetical protein
VLRLAALGVLGAGLAGCSGGPGGGFSRTAPVRPEDPTTWPPDTELLLRARARVAAYRRALAALAPAAGDRAPVRALGPLWATQQDRLEQLLTLSGVPLPALDHPAGNAGPGPGDAGATGTGAPRALGLAQALTVDLEVALTDVLESTATHRALLAALAAQHTLSAQDLGAPADSRPLPGPSGAAAVTVLAATRPAVFGLEVAAARAGQQEREALDEILVGVRALSRQLVTLAGPAAPAPPLGYHLPEPLESSAQRSALARALVHDIAPAALSTLDRATGTAHPSGVVRIVVRASAWHRDLGSTPSAFPGMVLP